MFKKSLVLFMVLLLCSSLAWGAAGTVTGTCSNIMGGITRTITLSWSAASDSGTVPTKSTDAITCGQGGMTVTQFIEGYYLCSAETSTTVAHRPTDDYDIEILDALGLDKMGGALANRDQNNTEEAAPKITAGAASAPGCRYITGALTFSLTNNSVNAAAGTVTLYFSRPQGVSR